MNLEQTRERIVAQSIISGYLVNRVSKYLNNKLPKSSVADSEKLVDNSEETISENEEQHPEQDHGLESAGQDGDAKSIETGAAKEIVNINVSINEQEDNVEDETKLKDENVEEMTDSEKVKIKKDISLEVQTGEEIARRDTKLKPYLRKKKGFLTRFNDNRNDRNIKEKHKKRTKKYFQDSIKYGKIKKHKHGKHHTEKKSKKYKKQGKRSSNINRQNKHKMSGLSISDDNEVR